MTTINLKDKRQAIDYLARDYYSFRQALVDLIPAKLPEWTDRSEADFGIVLIELFAYMGDILSYYQDRIADESFLTTAQERRSVITPLRLVGYEMAPAAPAAAKLSLIVGNTVNDVVTIRKGDQFATASRRDRKSVTFEYTEDKPLVIDLSKAPADSARKPDLTELKGFKEVSGIIPVREGRYIVNEGIGVSDGTPNQRFRLAQPSLLKGSLELTVETTPPTPPWRERKTLLFSRGGWQPEQVRAREQQERTGSTLAFSRGADPDYMTETDENDVTTVVFGDGQYGAIPPSGARIRATYRVGGGSTGNVGAGQITVIAKAPQLQLIGAKVVNRSPATGGAERESIENAVAFAPTVFSSMQRAVTAQDYEAQAKLFPGVSKARAEATNWNVIKLYIAPTGSGEPPTDILKRDLLAYFEDRRMITSSIEIGIPDYIRIVITVEVVAKPYFLTENVKGAAENAIFGLYDFEKVSFGQKLYLSKIYEALEGLDGVESAYVSVFRRHDGSDPIAKDGVIQLGENEIPVLRTEDLSLTVIGGA